MDEKKYENIKKWEYEQRMKEIEKIQQEYQRLKEQSQRKQYPIPKLKDSGELEYHDQDMYATENQGEEDISEHNTNESD